MRKGLGILAAIMITGVIASGCGTSGASGGNYPNAQLLVDANWVKGHVNDDKLIVIDARSKGYDQGHLPKAVNLPSGQINDPKNHVKGFLLSADGYTQVVQKAGVNQDSTILLYDDGDSLSATRIFYSLEYYGLKDHVKVLNGGYAAWQAAGGDVSTTAVTNPKGNFVAKEQTDLVSTEQQVQQNLDNKNFVFLDARSPDEYVGKDLRGNKKGGHIPGAVNQEWTNAIATGSDGVPKFKSYKQLTDDFAKLGITKDKTVVPYCQTNVRGAHSYFALRLIGFKDVRPYEGSWAEWGNDDKTPVVQ
jgi:thiosulfate/3-mercaptopyruvate sulfurtransferase